MDYALRNLHIPVKSLSMVAFLQYALPEISKIYTKRIQGALWLEGLTRHR